jgi:hypothetical protein
MFTITHQVVVTTSHHNEAFWSGLWCILIVLSSNSDMQKKRYRTQKHFHVVSAQTFIH